jgi:hypothetical protein
MIVAIFFFSNANTSLADDGSGMKVSASVDAVGDFKANKDSNASDRFDIREAEVLIYGPIDHLFDGTLSLAAHRESGVSMFEIHEAHIGSSKLIPRSRFKLGQFFLGVGRLNRFHRHEWPFITTPTVQARFFGDEGVVDSGAEYSYLLPLPFFLDLTVGLTNGFVYGHAHNEGEKPKQPTHYARLGTYFAVFGDGGAQIGVNYLGRKAANNETMTLVGTDIVAKWRSGAVIDFLLQSEVWHRTRKPEAGEVEKSLGAYLLPQAALGSHLQFGIRLDYYSVLTLKDVTGADIPNHELGIVPTLTYKASEFSSFRAAYSHGRVSQEGSKELRSDAFQVQTTFMLGAHPAHDF